MNLTTITVVVALIAAVAFLILWIKERDKRMLNENKQVQNGVGQSAAVQNGGNGANKESDKFGTPLTPELVKKAIEFNGFVPLPNEDPAWSAFKIQGETYFVGYFGSFVHFYKGYNLEQDMDCNLLQESISKTYEVTPTGRIKADQQSHLLSYSIFTAERTYEHLCESFMNNIDLLNDLVVKQRDAYLYLLEQQNQPVAETASQPETVTAEGPQKIVS